MTVREHRSAMPEMQKPQLPSDLPCRSEQKRMLTATPALRAMSSLMMGNEMPSEIPTTGLNRAMRIVRRLLAYNLAAFSCLLAFAMVNAGLQHIRPAGIVVMVVLLFVTIKLFNPSGCDCRG